MASDKKRPRTDDEPEVLATIPITADTEFADVKAAYEAALRPVHVSRLRALVASGEKDMERMLNVALLLAADEFGSANLVQSVATEAGKECALHYEAMDCSDIDGIASHLIREAPKGSMLFEIYLPCPEHYGGEPFAAIKEHCKPRHFECETIKHHQEDYTYLLVCMALDD